MIFTKINYKVQPPAPSSLSFIYGNPLFVYCPTFGGIDLTGRNKIVQCNPVLVQTIYGIGATFSSGKWIQYDATNAGGGSSDNFPVTRVYVVQYGSQGYQWLSSSSATGSSEILGHGWSTANLNCFSSTNDVILNTEQNKYYVIIIRANNFGSTSDAWVNGTLIDTWTNTDSRSGSTVYLGRRYSSDSEWFTGKLLVAYTLQGIVTNSIVKEISENPWAIFLEDAKKIVPFSGTTSYTILANSGSYLITGQQATVLKNKLVSANYGIYSVSGQTATILRSKVITATNGTYTLTGQTAAITYVSGGTNYTLVADKGDYTYTGQTATLLRSKLINAVNGTYSISGQNATLSYSGSNTITLKAGSWLRYRIIQ